MPKELGLFPSMINDKKGTCCCCGEGIPMAEIANT